MLLKSLSWLVRWSVLLCVPGGVLWALTPLGISLAEYRFSAPAVFWKLFPSAPLLIILGLIGLQVWQSNQQGRAGWLGTAGFGLAILGLVLIVLGDVGKFWLDVDDTYLTLAPAYRAMRIGFAMFALGSIVFASAALRARTLPIWGVAPFALFSLGGLVAVSADLGTLGATLWILFGVGWAWLGVSPLAASVAAAGRTRRKSRVS